MQDKWPKKKFFTFHSGYIPIIQQLRLFFSLYFFTFHSGYIPIDTMMYRLNQYEPLHSILVIFQSVSFISFMTMYHLTLHSILVIFQFLPAVRLLTIDTSLHSILVIFQSFTGIAKAMAEQLYIPFWLYSNFFG